MKTLLEKISDKRKTVVFTFGRFNPPTIGHEKLIQQVEAMAKQFGGQPRIYTSHSQDPHKNPLHYEDKISFLEEMFPRSLVVKSQNIRNIIDVLVSLKCERVTDVLAVVGGDRLKGWPANIKQFMESNKRLSFDRFKIVSAGARNNASTISGMSGTKMRGFAAANEAQEFFSGVPSLTSEYSAQKMFSLVRKGMGILEARDYAYEYASYHSRPEQILRRSQRNQARRVMVKWGEVSVGDKLDVHHKDHNTENNSPENLEAVPRSLNRAANRDNGPISFSEYSENTKKINSR